MGIRKLSEAELADLAKNVVTLLGGSDLSSIESHLRSELVSAAGSLPDDLAAQSTAAAVIDAEKKAAVSTKNATYDELILWMNRVRDALKAGLAPKKEYDLCGIDYPLQRAGMYVAADPTDLAVTGFSNGLNRGRFNGNNVSGRVMYEVWRRQGDEGPWLKHILTSKQSFGDTPVTPGQYYEYKVRAVAAQTISNFSNSAVVYGVQ